MSNDNFVINENNAKDALNTLIEKTSSVKGLVTATPDEIIETLMAYGNKPQAKFVHGFLTDFGLTTTNAPTMEIGTSELNMCANIIVEELFEVFECFGNRGLRTLMHSIELLYDKYEEKMIGDKDITIQLPIQPIENLLKELTDLVVVTHNLTSICGLHNYFDDAFTETMWSNISKGYATDISAGDDCEEINLREGKTIVSDTQYCHVEQPVKDKDWYVIRRTSDGKILKGSHYRSANINKILNPKTND